MLNMALSGCLRNNVKSVGQFWPIAFGSNKGASGSKSSKNRGKTHKMDGENNGKLSPLKF